MKSLTLYQQQIASLKKQRAALDTDFAQVLAEGITDGYSILDMLDSRPAPNQPEFDL